MGLRPWQWCLMVMVVFSGRLCSGWLVSFLVFLIERNFMLREKVLYFVYGLRKSIQSCIWLALVLLAWTCMFDAQVHQNNKVVKRVSQLLVAVLVGAIIWLVKIVLVKTLASSFHVRTYFDRMKESVFHHYILDALSGPPMDELLWEQHKPMQGSKSLPTKWKDAKEMMRSKKYGSRKLDMEKLKELSKESPASIWSLKRLMNFIRSSSLSTISKTVDEFGKAESEITSEWEARTTAKRIFRNVAKRGAKYIEEEDLARFLKRNEIHAIFPLFEGALETGRITKSSFRNWVVRAYFERKALAHSLNDTKTAVQQLHKMASAIVTVVIFVVFLLLMGLATPKVVAFVITQMVVLGVIFHNTCKTIFDCIIFVFVMHPFDIGDRCKVDGVQMIVEEMNILTTVFLRYDMEKIYYPNSALLSKPISNFYRSPEMWDTIPFTIDASTPIESINALKKATQSYIDSKPNHWNSKHSFIVKDIEDLNTMKMALCVQHTINHQNIGERNLRLTDLILELKKNFENLGIKYHLLPQEVHLTQFNINNSPKPTPS
uniref:Mechanosensitive ion channel MscS domain-containing protein n=1 Tax=Chenopodium quinoa TaxID=63459 RepID=A0A803MCZ6_CHEQI